MDYLKQFGVLLRRLTGKSLRAAFYVVAVPLLTWTLVAVALRPFNLYLDLRDTVIEFGKAAHMAIKKPNSLTLKIGHSDSAAGLRDDYELSKASDECAGIWFAVVNHKGDETYTGVRLFLRFDEPAATRVSMRRGEGWQMFKQGHFNFSFPDPILPGFLMQTAQIELCFTEVGPYPFQYVLYADEYRRAVGTRIIRVR